MALRPLVKSASLKMFERSAQDTGNVGELRDADVLILGHRGAKPRVQAPGSESDHLLQIRLGSPMPPVAVMMEAAESKEDARCSIVPVSIAVMAIAVAATPAPTPVTMMPAAPVHGIDLAGDVFADTA
jgi:hypothetical protein